MSKNRKGRRKSKHRKQQQLKTNGFNLAADPPDCSDGFVDTVDQAATSPHETNSDASLPGKRNSGKRKEISLLKDEAGAPDASESAKKHKLSTQGTPPDTTKEVTDALDRVSSEAETTVAQAPDFPFPIDADDHCESPLEAYQDLSPLLTQVCGNVKTCASMRIYDPYYCDGAVIRNLSQVGFLNVYNRKKDCYAVWALSNAPDFDVLVTNPPYSDDHIEKLVRYITSDSFGKRPWFLLLPQWVHKKNFYVTATSHIRPFYLVPRKRYVYLPPKNFRQSKKSDVHKKSSPFVSMWYCWGGAMNDALIQKYSKDKLRDDSSCDLARSKSALRDLRRKPQR